MHRDGVEALPGADGSQSVRERRQHLMLPGEVLLLLLAVSDVRNVTSGSDAAQSSVAEDSSRGSAAPDPPRARNAFDRDEDVVALVDVVGAPPSLGVKIRWLRV